MEKKKFNLIFDVICEQEILPMLKIVALVVYWKKYEMNVVEHVQMVVHF